MKVKHNGMHGLKRLEFRPAETGWTPLVDEYLGIYYRLYRVSKRTAERLNREVCGYPECECGERMAFPAPDPDGRELWYVPVPCDGSAYRGNHYDLSREY